MNAHVAQCRYMAAAYPTLDAHDTCSEHRHDDPTFALARALAEVCQQPEPSDEQIGWFLNDAAAVVDDFDPTPDQWTATAPQPTSEVGVEFTMTINGRDYVIELSEWDPSHPLSRADYDAQMAEANR